MKLFFREYGQGKPIIILHGIFGTCDNWVTVAKKLAENYRVITADLRNHGNTGHSPEMNYDVMVEDIKELIATENIEDPYIIGHSMGGKVAMHFAGKYPEMLGKLIVIDIAPKAYTVHHQQHIDAMKSLDLQKIQSRSEADKKMAEKVAEASIRQFLLKNLYRKEDKTFAWKLNLEAIENNLQNLSVGLPDNVEVDLPALFMRGAMSDYIKDSDAFTIKDHFPEASITTVYGAGHWIHAEKPDEFTEVVNKFLSR